VSSCSYCCVPLTRACNYSTASRPDWMKLEGRAPILYRYRCLIEYSFWVPLCWWQHDMVTGVLTILAKLKSLMYIFHLWEFVFTWNFMNWISIPKLVSLSGLGFWQTKIWLVLDICKLQTSLFHKLWPVTSTSKPTLISIGQKKMKYYMTTVLVLHTKQIHARWYRTLTGAIRVQLVAALKVTKISLKLGLSCGAEWCIFDCGNRLNLVSQWSLHRYRDYTEPLTEKKQCLMYILLPFTTWLKYSHPHL